MAQTVIQGVAVRGVVCSVPGEPLDVAALGASFDSEEVRKILQTVGLRTLYRAQPGQTAGDLCIAAAKRLLDRLGWSPDSVDGLIMVTQNPDHFAPATACIAHRELGLGPQCLAFDVGMGCSGYVYGLWLGAQSVASRTSRRFLLLAGDTSSVVASPRDRSVALLFGDAGSATALEFSEDAAPMSFAFGTDGTGADRLIVPAGGYRQRATAEAFEPQCDEAGNFRSPMDLYMDGLAVFNFTLKRVPPVIREAAALREWTLPGGVDAVLMHQANAFILRNLGKKLGLAEAQLPINIDKFGNTSMATLPLLLADSLSERLLTTDRTDLVLAGFGVGLSWGAAGVTMPRLQAAEVIGV